MSLSKLNQDCLLGIFRDCSLSRKLALRQVSASWCALLEYHLARLPSLSVTEPYRGFPSNEHPLVLLRSGRTPAFTLISRLFPSLRQLGLFLRHSAPCSSLTLYIRQLAPNLTVLTIDDVTFIDWSLLGEGQLSSLRHLTIHHASWFSCNDPGKSVASMRALLRPLETFTCGTLYFGVLHHLGPSLRRLEIQVLEYYWSGYPCINGPFNCSASKSLEHLSIGAFKVWPLHLFEMSDVIRNLLSSFPTIKTLHLSVNSSLDVCIPFTPSKSIFKIHYFPYF